MAQEPTESDDLPETPHAFAAESPDVWEAYNDLGEAAAAAGPLDEETQRLVKLALAVGTQSEGAVHSHVRRGLQEGLSADELQHVSTLAVPTLGFPQAMAARSWISDLTEE